MTIAPIIAVVLMGIGTLITIACINKIANERNRYKSGVTIVESNYRTVMANYKKLQANYNSLNKAHGDISKKRMEVNKAALENAKRLIIADDLLNIDLDSYRNYEITRLKDDIKTLQDQMKIDLETEGDPPGPINVELTEKINKELENESTDNNQSN